jgi:orotidine-5'-phosphate decarboxylase
VKCDLILALDLPDEAQALRLLDRIGAEVDVIKIGLQMFTRLGPAFVERAAALGSGRIFLDLKLHDIPNTVASAVQSLGDLPIEFLTIHTCGGRAMMEAAEAMKRRVRPTLTLLGVTVLTSIDAAALRETGVDAAPETQVLRLARLAAASGLGGLVCSPVELPALRRELDASIKLVTPGVRPSGAALDDQQRVLTPGEAARAGASGIVVGRPIVKAPDPAAAARDIRAELAAALAPV